MITHLMISVLEVLQPLSNKRVCLQLPNKPQLTQTKHLPYIANSAVLDPARAVSHGPWYLLSATIRSSAKRQDHK